MDDIPEKFDAIHRLLEEYIAMRRLDLHVEVTGKLHNSRLNVEFEIYRKEDGKEWFCFSIVVDSNFQAGVWTREHRKKLMGSLTTPKEYAFDPDNFFEWLDEIFVENKKHVQPTDS